MRAAPAAREALRRNLRYQEAAIAGADHDGFLALDVAFHELLTGGLGLNRVADALGGLRLHLDRVRRLGGALGPNLVQLPPRWKRNAERLDEFRRGVALGT